MHKCCIGCVKDFETCGSDTFTTDETNDFDWCAEFEGAKNTEQQVQAYSDKPNSLT